MPDGVVNFCAGEGPEFGRAIVAHPQTRFIAFTGSKAVGLEIHQSAAKTQPGQIFIKRTILEMGGKDSIIVAADCDLDAAVEGVAASAFGFNGQKCSACSRVIVDAAIYDVFCDRLQARVEQIKVGDPAENFLCGAGDQREVVSEGPGLYCDRQDGGPVADREGMPSRCGGVRLLHCADGDCGCGAGCANCAGGDLRAGAGGDQVAWASTRRWRLPIIPSMD